MELNKSNIISNGLYWWFWIATCYGFVCDEWLPTDIAPIIARFVLVMCDCAIMLMGLWCTRNKTDIFITASFVGLSFISTCIINHLPLITWVNGSRVFWGFIFVVPVLRYICDDEELHNKFMEKWDKALLYWLYVQAFCITWEYFEYGAGDPGGGSFGILGYSGTVSMSIYAASFYLIRKRLDTNHLWFSILQNWKYIALLIPTFMNETKISFILLFLYFVLLIPINRKTATRLLLGIPIIAGIIAIAIFIFSSLTMYNGSFTADDVFTVDFIEKYLYTDIEQSESTAKWSIENMENETNMPDVPRLTKIIMLPIVFNQESGNILIGLGVGHFMNGGIFGTTELFENWDWLLWGTNPMIFFTIIQIGIIGLLWVLFVWASWFTYKPQKFKKRDINMQILVLAIVLSTLVYGQFFRIIPFCQILLTILFLSWQKQELPETNIITEKTKD